jgi:hypothetical protein
MVWKIGVIVPAILLLINSPASANPIPELPFWGKPFPNGYASVAWRRERSRTVIRHWGRIGPRRPALRVKD